MEPAEPGFLGVDLLATGSWRAFERAILRLVIHQGFEWARMTAGPGDRGSDVVGFYRGAYWVAQAKFSVSGTTPGPGAVRQELSRAIGEYRASRAVLATNAPIEPNSLLERVAAEYSAHTGTKVTALGRRQLSHIVEQISNDPPTRSASPLRDYQEEAIEKIELAARTRTGSRAGALVAMATGTGKSRVLFEYLRRFVSERPGLETLVLVESVELAKQLERASWEVLPKGVTTHLWAGGETPAYSCGDSVTFATTDSVRAGWGVLARPHRYPLVVFDEAHHAMAEGNRRLLDDLAPVFRLGMTATPWRGDQRMVEAAFGGSGPIYRLSVVDAIKRGYLAGVRYLVFDDHIDWERIGALSKLRLTLRDLNRRLWIPERENRVAAIVREWIDQLSERGLPPRTLVFCRSIEHTNRATTALHAAGVPAASLHSGQEKFEVTRRLQQFRDGELRVLTVVDMLNEGIDVPDVQLIVFNRVTHSRRVFLQQLGRGLRRTPEKHELTVLDFVSDIRRLAELLEMEREYESTPPGSEELQLASHLVSFGSNEMQRFVDAYLADVGDLTDAQDDLALFPPDRAPD